MWVAGKEGEEKKNGEAEAQWEKSNRDTVTALTSLDDTFCFFHIEISFCLSPFTFKKTKQDGDV